MDYNSLKNKYESLITTRENFDQFLDDLLKEYFHNKNIIDLFYEERRNDHEIFSDKEFKLDDDGDKIYHQILSLCDPSKQDEMDDLLYKFSSNHFELLELYTRQFYEYGFRDHEKILKELK